jgi:large subunit ribosomal protein L30
MRYLRLTRANHCVFLPQTPSTDGMLQKAKDYITWGEVDPTVAARVLIKRARLLGNKAIDDAWMKANTKFSSVNTLAKAITEGKASLKDVPGLKPVLRLHPPRGGFGGSKRAFRAGGSLGYRGKDINDLILRMLGPEGS